MQIDSTFAPDREWTRAPGAAAQVLEDLRREVPVTLPEELYAFYARSDGGEGELGGEPGWFSLWRAEDLLALNREYDIAAQYPGYFGFGSNGGGELLALEVSTGRCGRVAMVAFVGGEPLIIAESFLHFVDLIGRRYAGDDC